MKAGDHKDCRKQGTYVYTERPGLHSFLEFVFQRYDVAIWTSAGKFCASRMIKLLFTNLERKQFKFIFCQEETTDADIPRPDGKCNIFMKDFKKVWSKFPDLYDSSNIVLIDDCRWKGFLNPSWTQLIPSPFICQETSDDFLMVVLAPYLDKLALAYDVRQFLFENLPKWSFKNYLMQWEVSPNLYNQLFEKHGTSLPENIWKHTVFDFTREEISWSYRDEVMKVQSVEDLALKYPMVPEIFLGRQYVGPYRENVMMFYSDILYVRDTTRKFTVDGSEKECNRDMRVDMDGKRLTCSNRFCLLH